jgi:SAM-dependent methyltransferase
MDSDYKNISVLGGDTGQPLAMGKRLRYIRSYSLAEDTRFLDCGCGAGDYVFELVEQFGLDAYGLEFDTQKVGQAKLQPKHGFRISQGDVQATGYDSDCWDCVMLNEVLEHVPDDRAALREVNRILKPGGLLFVFSPNRWFPFETHGVHLKRSGRHIPPWYPFVPYIPLGIGNRFLEYWARNYWQSELRLLVSSAGFSIIRTGFIWQTFEGISQGQPAVLTFARPVLRKLANFLESLPFVSRFGVSQVLVCRK